MRELLLILAACVLLLLGIALLALNQKRHRDLVFKSNVPVAHNPHAQRATGLIAIGGGLPTCIASQGASFGSLLWVLLLSSAAMAVALTLSWRPQWLRPLAHAARFFFSIRPSRLP